MSGLHEWPLLVGFASEQRIETHRNRSKASESNPVQRKSLFHRGVMAKSEAKAGRFQHSDSHVLGVCRI